MFNSYDIENYNFDGIEKQIRIFNTNFNLSEYSTSFYAEKISDNFLLDTFADSVFNDTSYYYIPIYTNNIVNPFLELPPTKEQIEIELENFKSGLNGFTGVCLQAGDLVVKFSSGFSAQFDVETSFGYIAEVDYELEKIKMLVDGISGGTANNSYRVIREENGTWKPIVGSMTSGFVISPNSLFVENYSSSPVFFENQYGIITKSITDSGYSDGSPDNGYIPVSEKDNLIETKNILNIPSINKVKFIGDLINASS